MRDQQVKIEQRDWYWTPPAGAFSSPFVAIPFIGFILFGPPLMALYKHRSKLFHVAAIPFMIFGPLLDKMINTPMPFDDKPPSYPVASNSRRPKRKVLH